MLAALAAALAVGACGSNSSSSSSSSSSGTGAPGNGTDRAFVDMMVPHHQSAIAMAKIAQKRGQSQFVKTLAGNIIRTQGEEISTMKAEDAKLAKAGVKMGGLGMDGSMMGMNMNTGMLKMTSNFDQEFFTMMIKHHQGAISMARMELDKGSDPKLRSLAQAIIKAQQKEISDMKAQQKGA